MPRPITPEQVAKVEQMRGKGWREKVIDTITGSENVEVLGKKQRVPAEVAEYQREHGWLATFLMMATNDDLVAEFDAAETQREKNNLTKKIQKLHEGQMSTTEQIQHLVPEEIKRYAPDIVKKYFPPLQTPQNEPPVTGILEQLQLSIPQLARKLHTAIPKTQQSITEAASEAASEAGAAISSGISSTITQARRAVGIDKPQIPSLIPNPQRGQRSR